MAYQLIYTSIRSGLIAGRSGFCTAARHREIKESLVARLEDFASAYDRGILGREGVLPILYSYRIVDIRDNRYHVLMRLGDAGNDYSGRTNHLAHFFIIEPEELAGLRISPAEAILALKNQGLWKVRYDGSASYLGDEDIIHMSTILPAVDLPASAWAEWSGNPGNAAHLYDSEGPQKTGFPTAGNSEESAEKLLRLFAEGALLGSPERNDPVALWSVPFTTLLQSSSERRTFPWAGVPEGTPLAENEAASGRNLFRQGTEVSPPDGNLAALAAGREVEQVYSPVDLPSEEMASAEPQSPQPEQSEVAMGVEQTSQPKEDLPASPPASGPQPSISTSYAARERKTRRGGGGFLKPSLIAAATVCLLGLIGSTIYHFVTKERREFEADITELMDKKLWAEVDKKLRISPENPDLIKGEFEGWKLLAHAIVRLEKIEKTPYNSGEIVPGSDSPDAAIVATVKDVPEPQVERLSVYKKEAEAEVKAWQKAKKKAEDELTRAIRKVNEAVNTTPISDFPSKEEKSLSAAKEELRKYYDGLDAKEDPTLLKISNFGSVKDQFEKLKAYEAESTETVSNEKPVNLEALEKYIQNRKDYDDETRKSLKYINSRFESIYEARRPKETLPSGVAAAETPEPEKEMPTKSEEESVPLESWPVYLVAVIDDRLDLSSIEELNSEFPKFRIEPIESDALEVDSISGQRHYARGKQIFTSRGEKVLEIEDEYLPLFANRTKLLPISTPPDFEVTIMSGEASPNSKGLIENLPFSKCVKKSGTAFQVAEIAAKELERLKLPPGGEWTMVLQLDNEDWSDKGRIESLEVNPVADVSARLQEARAQKSLMEEKKAIDKEFASTFRLLGNQLFPGAVGMNWNHNLEIVEKDGVHLIQHVKNDGKDSKLNDAWKVFNESHNTQYTMYVKNLFIRLDYGAGKSQKYKTATGSFETARRMDRKKPVGEIVQVWKDLAKKSKQEKWAETPRPPSGSETNAQAEDKLKIYAADLYFSEFFKGWENVFSDEKKTERLVEYLSPPQRFTSIPPLEQPDQKIAVKEDLLRQLKDDDLLSRLQVSYSYDFMDIQESGPKPKSFLVLRSKPDPAD